jgi:hypothetical protein
MRHEHIQRREVVYGRNHWVCALNPSDSTLEAVRPLLKEAYEIAAKRARRRTKRSKG